jgi:hypothetical protein
MNQELENLPCKLIPEDLYNKLLKDAPNKAQLLNKDDKRWSIVNWTDKNSQDLFNVVPMGNFIKNQNNESYKLDGRYKCYWDDLKKHGCVIKFIGTLGECKKEEVNFKPADQNIKLKAKIRKDASTKNIKDANAEMTTIVQHEITQRELTSANELIKSQSVEIEQLKQEINRLKISKPVDQINTPSNINGSNIDTLSIIDKDNFLKIAKCILNLFGSRSDVEELEIKDLNDDQMVHLTNKHELKVKQEVKRRINKLKQDKEKPTYVIRFLVNSLTESMDEMKDEKDKGAYNAETFKRKFKTTYDAINGMYQLLNCILLNVLYYFFISLSIFNFIV